VLKGAEERRRFDFSLNHKSISVLYTVNLACTTAKCKARKGNEIHPKMYNASSALLKFYALLNIICDIKESRSEEDMRIHL
jgi:hypothetical protein